MQQLTKRQLKQFQSDSLSVFVYSNPPRTAVLCLPRTDDRVFLFADDTNVAEACANQFYSDAIQRLQTLEPSIFTTEEAIHYTDGSMPIYVVVSLVARSAAFPPLTPAVVDLADLESRVTLSANPSWTALFDPEEYPGLVWLDEQVKTIVFPSGALVVHGKEFGRMEESLRRKIPLIQKSIIPPPNGVVRELMERK